MERHCSRKVCGATGGRSRPAVQPSFRLGRGPIKYHLDIDEIELQEFNFKSKLLEWTQKEKKTMEYKVAEIKETSRNKIYYIEVYIDNVLSGKGSGLSIKNAEQNASEDALKKI